MRTATLKLFKRFTRFLLYIFLAGFLALSLFLIRLSFGPISLDSWKSSLLSYVQKSGFPIEESINFENASLSLGNWRTPIEVQVENFSVRDLKIPRVRLGFSVKNALRGQVSFTHVTCENISLNTHSMSQNLLDNPASFGAVQSVLKHTKVIHLKNCSFAVSKIDLPAIDLRVRLREEKLLVDAASSQNKHYFLRSTYSLNSKKDHISASFYLKGMPLSFISFSKLGHENLRGLLSPLPDLSGEVHAVYSTLNKQVTSGKIDITSQDRHCPLTQLKISGPIRQGTFFIQNSTAYLCDIPCQVDGALSLNPFENVTDSFLRLSVPSPTSVETVKKIWPQGSFNAQREWVLKHVYRGNIQKISLKFQPRNTVAFSGKIDFTDVTMCPHKNIPEVKNLSGHAIFDSTQFSVFLSKGDLQKQTLSQGRIYLKELDTPHRRFRGTFLFKGNLQDKLDIAASLSSKNTHPFFQDTRHVKGRAETQLDLAFPLKESLTLSEIIFIANAHITNGSLTKDLNFHGRSYQVGHADLNVSLTKKTLEVTGGAHFNQIPVQIKWTENFSGKVSQELRLTADLQTKSIADLSTKNLLNYIQGPIKFSLHYTPTTDPSLFKIRFDLKDSTINLPFLQWTKKQGALGKLAGNIKFLSAGTFHAQDMRLNSSGLDITGNSVWRSPATLEQAHIHILQAPQTKDVTLKITNGHIIDIEASGQRLNIQSLLEGATLDSLKSNWIKPSQSLKLKACLDAVHTGVSDIVTQVNAECHGHRKDQDPYTGLVWDKVMIQGNLQKDGAFPSNTPHNTSEKFSIKILPQVDKMKRLTVYAPDCGKLLKFLRADWEIEGGVLSIVATQKDQLHPYIGKLRMHDFSLVKMPLLFKVLALSSPTGIINFFSPQGLSSFDMLNSSFTYHNGLTTIHQARARSIGFGLGLSAHGQINERQRMISLKGNVIPGYMLQYSLGLIPFFGRLFTGGEDNGILATSFTIKGPIDNPKIYSNPLSIFAIGPLKELWKAFEESVE